MSTVAVEFFLEAPEATYEETKSVIDEAEEYVESKAKDFEQSLENNNYSDGELKIDNFKFYTVRKEQYVEDIIAKCLFFDYDGKWSELNQEIEKKTKGYHGENIEDINQNSSRKLRIIKKVYDLLHEERDDIESWVSSDSGAHYSPYKSSTFGDENGIVMRIIPRPLVRDMGATYHHLLESLVNKYSTYNVDQEQSAEQNFNATLLHELNHAYLDNLSGESIRKGPGPANALNEVFAYYTSYLVCGRKFEDAESELYEMPEVIVWGVKIMVEKNEELEERGVKNTGIDFQRSLMKRVGKSENPFRAFIFSCILTKDSRRIRNANQVIEDLNDSIPDYKGYLREVKDSSSEKIQQWAVESIIDEMGDIPEADLEGKLTQKINSEIRYRNKESSGDLEELSRMIKEYLTSISSELQKLEENILEEREYFDNQEVNRNLTQMAREVEKHRKSLNQVIKK